VSAAWRRRSAVPLAQLGELGRGDVLADLALLDQDLGQAGAGSRERVVGYGAWVFEEPGGERRPAGMPDGQARG
jgi:hypothetical protein